MFELKKLPYDYNDLEPFLSKEALEIHYLKHHKAYTDNFNKVIIENNLEGKSIKEIFSNISQYPKAVENQGGGYFNHQFFWESMAKKNSEENQISERLLEMIEKSFNSFDEFKEEFEKKAMAVFGSGWTWLVENPNLDILEIHNTFNQESPEMDFIIERNGEVNPLLNLDLWEHSYYVDYRNLRAEYVKNFWDVVNWKKVEERLLENVNDD